MIATPCRYIPQAFTYHTNELHDGFWIIDAFEWATRSFKRFINVPGRETIGFTNGWTSWVSRTGPFRYGTIEAGEVLQFACIMALGTGELNALRVARLLFTVPAIHT